MIPIADRHIDAARELAAELRAGGLRFVEVDDSDNRMQNKIRLAQGQKVPYMLILGDREVEARTAAVRRRGAAKDEPQEVLPWAATRLPAAGRRSASGASPSGDGEGSRRARVPLRPVENRCAILPRRPQRAVWPVRAARSATSTKGTTTSAETCASTR